MITSFLVILSAFVLSFIEVSDGKADTARICVSVFQTNKTTGLIKNCEILAGSKKTRVTCVFGKNRLDCLRLVSERKAEFTVLEAEDLIFAKGWRETSSSVLVVSEIRATKRQQYNYEAVVVIRNEMGVATDLRGAKICHPGSKFNLENKKNILFTQYLEDRLAPQSCTPNMTLNEDRIQTSASYFGPSCKAGEWSEDFDEDARLKAKYSSLCQLCDNPVKCANSDKYGGAGGAVTCFMDKVGEVLWSTYNDVHNYFKLSNPSSDLPLEQFNFLCEDGSKQPLNTSTPCHWLARPNDVIVANMKAATDVQKMLQLLKDQNSLQWEESLMNIIEAFKEYMWSLPAAKTPEDYLETIPGYMTASEMNRPNCRQSHDITWCTHSPSAYRKCRWISTAALACGIEPTIRCVEKPSIKQCLEAVAGNEADVVVISPDYQPIAMKYYNMMPIFHESQSSAYMLSAIVRRESPITKPSDLQSHRACVTLHEGFAWRSVLVHLRAENLVSRSCGSSGLIQGFFESVCVTDGPLDDSDLPRCCPGASNGSDPDTAAFKCLAVGGCDVAFVQSTTLPRNTNGNNHEKWAKNLRSDDFRFICNEKQSPCTLSWSYPGAVMISEGRPDWKYMEIHRLFHQIGRKFSRIDRENNVMFTMFGEFEDEENVLFQDTTKGFISQERVETSPYSFVDIFNKTKYCSSSSTIVPALSVAVVTLCFLLV